MGVSRSRRAERTRIGIAVTLDEHYSCGSLDWELIGIDDKERLNVWDLIGINDKERLNATNI